MTSHRIKGVHFHHLIEAASGSGGSWPPIGLTTPTTNDDEDEASIDVGLHVAPLRDVSSSAPQPFDCQPSLWSAELSVMIMSSRS